MHGTRTWSVNTLRPRQNDHHFVDDILKFIILCENCISIDIQPKCGPINNKKSIGSRNGLAKPLSEPMMTRLTDAQTYFGHSPQNGTIWLCKQTWKYAILFHLCYCYTQQ